MKRRLTRLSAFLHVFPDVVNFMPQTWHSHMDIQGVPLFLPPPYFPMCQNRRKNRVRNWPPSEMTESRTCHPQKMAESRTLVSLGVASCGLCHFLGDGKFWTLSFQRVASSGLCFFSILTGKLGGGKNSGTPCMQLFMWETTLKPMHCQMCKMYLKKKQFPTCIVA